MRYICAKLSFLYLSFTIMLSAGNEIVTQTYPISKEAVELIIHVHDPNKAQSNPSCSPSAAFFSPYGIKFGEGSNSLAYDGSSFLIKASQEDQKKIALIIQVVEDMVIANKKLSNEQNN